MRSSETIYLIVSKKEDWKAHTIITFKFTDNVFIIATSIVLQPKKKLIKQKT